MKKSLLLSSAAILLFGMARNFDGQEKSSSHRQLPGGGDTVIARQGDMAPAPVLSRQAPHRWTIDQTLPYRHRMTKPMGHQNDRTHATMSWRTPAQHELSAGVDTAWVRHYASGLAPSHDWATAIAVNGLGNVYVTGSSERFANVSDYLTVKYDSFGAQLWMAHYDGPGNATDEAHALAVDASGNVYVTGSSAGLSTGWDYATVKYNSAGVEQWVARYNRPGNSYDEASALAVDASGNVYVTGRSIGSGGEYATVKYNSAGVQQWVACYNGPGDYLDQATALAVDASGNVYVTGSSGSIGTWIDFATVKYNAAGVEQWVARYSRPGHFSEDGASALAVDAAGNVYVTGSSATIKYNSDGIQQWVVSDRGNALAVDAAGNVYVTGSGATIKYNSDGIQQWVTRYSGADNDWGWDIAVAVDASGNVYVTGTSVGSGTGDDFTTIKYNSAGVEQWVARYNGPGNTDDRIAAMALDASGNIYVTGSSEGDGGSVYTTIKYIQTPVSVVSEESDKPRAYDLSQNYPNPFNPATTIEFALPKASFVTLKIYGLLGNEVATLVSERLPAGKHQRVWEAKGLASGVYLYRLETGDPSTSPGRGFVQTRKLVLMR